MTSVGVGEDHHRTVPLGWTFSNEVMGRACARSASPKKAGKRMGQG